ncbi:MAG: YcxB family protein [Chlorobia bacterium]|nr:YcxB family protein [Fimbriimonadaceae bacterium]
MKPIETAYVFLTEDEYVANSMWAYRRRVQRMLLLSIFGIVAFIAGFLIPHETVVIAGLCIAGIGFADPLYVKGLLQKRHRDPKNTLMQMPMRAVIFESQSGVSSTIPWTTFIDIEEYGGNILLYIAKESPIVMLRRAQSAEAWSLFSALVETKRATIPP